MGSWLHSQGVLLAIFAKLSGTIELGHRTRLLKQDPGLRRQLYEISFNAQRLYVRWMQKAFIRISKDLDKRNKELT